MAACRLVPASVRIKVPLSKSMARSPTLPGTFAPRSCQRKRPAIIKWITRNSSPSNSKTIRLPRRWRSRTCAPRRASSGGSMERSRNGLASLTFSTRLPTTRGRSAWRYKRISGSSGIDALTHWRMDELAKTIRQSVNWSIRHFHIPSHRVRADPMVQRVQMAPDHFQLRHIAHLVRLGPLGTELAHSRLGLRFVEAVAHVMMRVRIDAERLADGRQQMILVHLREALDGFVLDPFGDFTELRN